jgi:hypothetical protein
LSIELTCANLLRVDLPKAVAACSVHQVTSRPKGEGFPGSDGMKDGKPLREATLTVLWNLATRSVEPVDCPLCSRPGFEFEWHRRGGLACPSCSTGRRPGKGGLRLAR